MSERKVVTKKLALEYRRAGKARKGQILDELCRLTDWHRNHARKALKQALLLKAVRPRPPRPPIYGPAVVKALRFLWAVQGTPRAGGCWPPGCCSGSPRRPSTGAWPGTGRG